MRFENVYKFVSAEVRLHLDFNYTLSRTDRAHSIGITALLFATDVGESRDWFYCLTLLSEKKRMSKQMLEQKQHLIYFQSLSVDSSFVFNVFLSIFMNTIFFLDFPVVPMRYN